MRGETFVALGVVAAFWSGCDDVGRAVGRNADNLDDASRWADNIVVLIRSSDELAQAPLSTRIPQVANEFEVSPELKRAWDGLVWQVGCDLATGEAPSTLADLDDYIIARGLEFALEVQGEAAAQLGERLIAEVDPEPFKLAPLICTAIGDFEP